MARFDKIKQLPVFKVAEEMLELAEVIVDALKEDERTEHFAREILSNAMLIPAKIAGAQGGQLYSLRMENAVVIKLAVRDMLNAVICTEMFEMNQDDYVQLMREKVEEFRLVFTEWIRGFNKANDLPDGWAIRYDTSTREEDKLLELMFDEDEMFGHDEDLEEDDGDEK